MNKVGGSLISMCGHKPEGLVEHETLIINTPIESICFHHFQLTLLIFPHKHCAFEISDIYKLPAGDFVFTQTSLTAAGALSDDSRAKRFDHQTTSNLPS